MTVISIDSFRKEKEEKAALNNELAELDTIFEASDAVLDVVEDNFDDGVVIGLLDGQLQISSSMDDIDSLLSFLESALQHVREDY